MHWGRVRCDGPGYHVDERTYHVGPDQCGDGLDHRPLYLVMVVGPDYQSAHEVVPFAYSLVDHEGP